MTVDCAHGSARMASRTTVSEETVTEQIGMRGYDGILLNLISLMELGGYGDRIDSLEELESAGWHDHDIIPMGGNLQLVYYRKNGFDPDDVLVKALINEREVTMPGEAVSGPYYRWKEIRKYYKDKLDAFKE